MYTELREIKSGEVYRHFKGSLYRIICVAKHTENGESLVIYEDLSDTEKRWARPLSMFNSLVDKEKYPHISQKYRFEKTGNSN